MVLFVSTSTTNENNWNVVYKIEIRKYVDKITDFSNDSSAAFSYSFCDTAEQKARIKRN